MNESAEKLSILDKQIREAIEKNPHSRNILHAFKKILLERKRLVEDRICMGVDVSGVDKIRLRAGVPVSRQAALLHPDEPWKKIALTMIPAIKAGLPSLAEDLQRIEKAFKEESVAPKDYFSAYPDLDAEAFDNWVAVLNIRPEAFHLLLISMLRPVLEMKAKEIVPLLGDFSWNKGYCPLCGAFPDFAVIKDKITERWLHCSLCRHEWRFNRVLCPFCEHEGKEEGVTYFFVEGREQETAFVCPRCSRYLITMNRVSDLGDHDFDVLSMGLAHLDMIMQEKGYIPVAFNEWNDFRTQQA